MGTRGLWGYVLDGERRLTYNHFDSYPGGLGQTVLDYARTAASDPGELDKLRAVKVVSEDGPTPTAEEIERLAKYADRGVGTRELTDWYVLLRNTQGDPKATAEVGYMLDAGKFYNDSLFCEWGYVIDFDSGVFEVYEGFQKRPHRAGRFAQGEGGDGYYPIRLVLSYPLANLPATLPTEG